MWQTGTLEIILISIVVIFTLVPLLALQRIFVKSGRAGWKAWIPVYNVLILSDVVGRTRLWGITLIVTPVIPVLGLVVAFAAWAVLMVDLGKVFGKNTQFQTLLILLPMIGLPILAYGGAQYQQQPVPHAPVVYDVPDDASDNG
jgi:hypothetical protein